MRWLLKIKPQFFLRLGLGATFLYSGIDLIRHPQSWAWALQNFPPVALEQLNRVGVNNYLVGQGVLELVLAAIFLVWFVPRGLVALAAFVAAVEFILILWFTSIDTVTFRDFGLAAAALALWTIFLKKGIKARYER